ncbi:terminase small subunit [Francisella adeliensis]|uniref:Terminase n=1 Tax=Francisella adeliensis TaxID=2007306 RepID=A0A2Z4XXQ4_9GAMM|nr:terminase small subunit [Francisella adeliensis]AXA33175.1 terminase [Francisella adeliensis]MBK2085933.1 terminase small subunit [Francisella adeliensis]MBK2096903.1 terminase small subunit [Francisella adeliensis]QIW11403.1 terminase small subunit [Francisella adeliensis]QIW13278.1 terminase small subunit [Francisella adeliensis]
MNKLTSKQLEFCKYYLQSGCMTEAYIQAYDTENMKDQTIHNEASKLLKNEKVAEFIESVQKREMLGTFNTRQKYLDKLDDIIDSDDSSMSEKIQAINTVAKLKQWDKRKAGLQVDFQEESDLLQRSLATDIGSFHSYPRKDI